MSITLLKSQRNECFVAAEQAGLNPTDFEWSDVKTQWKNNGPEPVAQLLHRPTGFYFVFDRYRGQLNPRYFPDASAAKSVDVGEAKTWASVLVAFKRWIATVQRERFEPDLWKLSQSDRKLVVAQLDDLENTPFAPEELQRISNGINELREFLLSTTSHTDTERQFILTRLKHLEDASTRLGRKDWVTLAMGTLVNIVVGVALAPEAARELLRTAGALFGWIAGGVHLIP